jgi:hypothetical protein
VLWVVGTHLDWVGGEVAFSDTQRWNCGKQWVVGTAVTSDKKTSQEDGPR